MSCSPAKTQKVSLGMGVCLTGLCSNLVPILERLQRPIYLGKSDISVGKSNDSPTLFWKLQKIWAVICGDAIFLRFSVCSADLDILCSGSFSHLVKFCSFPFLHKISTWVVCVNGEAPPVLPRTSVVRLFWV